MTKWVIYILTNPSFPEYVKIWYADATNQRLSQLNRSECIPFAFRIFAYYKVDERLTDMKLHKMIDKLNPNLRAIENFNWKKRVREFFAMDAEDAYSILETIAEINWMKKNLVKVNPTEKEQESEKIAREVEQKCREKAKSFSFYSIWIKDWDEIYFTRDPEKKAKVISDVKVEYEWETMTLSWLAAKLLGKNSSKWVWWPDFFSYNWKKINDIRRELWLINF